MHKNYVLSHSRFVRLDTGNAILTSYRTIIYNNNMLLGVTTSTANQPTHLPDDDKLKQYYRSPSVCEEKNIIRLDLKANDNIIIFISYIIIL